MNYASAMLLISYEHKQSWKIDKKDNCKTVTVSLVMPEKADEEMRELLFTSHYMGLNMESVKEDQLPKMIQQLAKKLGKSTRVIQLEENKGEDRIIKSIEEVLHEKGPLDNEGDYAPCRFLKVIQAYIAENAGTGNGATFVYDIDEGFIGISEFKNIKEIISRNKMLIKLRGRISDQDEE